ncbi:unnamed protein product [Vitrella brassicaformis CCMP3155]|uniref:Uncharacterized protein n=1 Tax=Vitrella brassicaformis (strain CCMP3155) TaxID=1169540 RepID=A0A0G4GRH2_VITBC|nr:unnamed protein product [Vitrella brassicaformis CCMP3155]|eukprot:CEM33157.1 unnamed protein product [Vitrella brassicaformis CCMP3155]
MQKAKQMSAPEREEDVTFPIPLGHSRQGLPWLPKEECYLHDRYTQMVEGEELMPVADRTSEGYKIAVLARELGRAESGISKRISVLRTRPPKNPFGQDEDESTAAGSPEARGRRGSGISGYSPTSPARVVSQQSSQQPITVLPMGPPPPFPEVPERIPYVTNNSKSKHRSASASPATKGYSYRSFNPYAEEQAHKASKRIIRMPLKRNEPRPPQPKPKPKTAGGVSRAPLPPRSGPPQVGNDEKERRSLDKAARLFCRLARKVAVDMAPEPSRSPSREYEEINMVETALRQVKQEEERQARRERKKLQQQQQRQTKQQKGKGGGKGLGGAGGMTKAEEDALAGLMMLSHRAHLKCEIVLPYMPDDYVRCDPDKLDEDKQTHDDQDEADSNLGWLFNPPQPKNHKSSPKKPRKPKPPKSPAMSLPADLPLSELLRRKRSDPERHSRGEGTGRSRLTSYNPTKFDPFHSLPDPELAYLHPTGSEVQSSYSWEQQAKDLETRRREEVERKKQLYGYSKGRLMDLLYIERKSNPKLPKRKAPVEWEAAPNGDQPPAPPSPMPQLDAMQESDFSPMNENGSGDSTAKKRSRDAGFFPASRQQSSETPDDESKESKPSASMDADGEEPASSKAMDRTPTPGLPPVGRKPRWYSRQDCDWLAIGRSRRNIQQRTFNDYETGRAFQFMGRQSSGAARGGEPGKETTTEEEWPAFKKCKYSDPKRDHMKSAYPRLDPLETASREVDLVWLRRMAEERDMDKCHKHKTTTTSGQK